MLTIYYYEYGERLNTAQVLASCFSLCNRLRRDSATRQTAGNDSKQLLYTRREQITITQPTPLTKPTADLNTLTM